MIDASILTDRIQVIYPAAKERDLFGHQETVWVEGHLMPAKVTWRRSDKALLAGDSYMSDQIGVTIRYRKSVTGRCRIRWQDHIYTLDGDPMGTYQSERMDFTATRLDDSQDKS